MLELFTRIFEFVLPALSVFLILLILVQRGRGGGLVGAFGGMGGQSDFGARAGDVFTKVTVITVSIWILICILLLLAKKHEGSVTSSSFGPERVSTTNTEGTNATGTTPIPAATSESQ